MLPKNVNTAILRWQAFSLFLYFLYYLSRHYVFLRDLHYVALFFMRGPSSRVTTFKGNTRKEAIWALIRLFLLYLFIFLPIGLFWFSLYYEPMVWLKIIKYLFKHSDIYHVVFMYSQLFFLFRLNYHFRR